MKKILYLLSALIFVSASAFAGDISLTYPGIKDFSQVSTSGSWDVTIKQGKEYTIKVTAPDSIIDKVQVMKENGTLLIGLESTGFWNWTSKTLRAEITMPNLSALESSGSGNTTFSGFTTKNMEIHTSGSSNVKGEQNKIQKLSLRTSGSSDISLVKSSITNADIHISGSSNIQLTMNGGDLTGDISGSGSIVYYGNAKTQSTTIFGSGNVTHRDKDAH